MAPLVRHLDADPDVESIVCVTGQHGSMLAQVLDFFRIVPHYDLALMTANQTLNGLAARLMTSLDDVFEHARPDRVLVHGDTTTANMAALAAFHRRIPVGHVEADLRTGDLQQPWPEEMNRRVVDVVSDLMFVPTSDVDHDEQLLIARSGGLLDAVAGPAVMLAGSSYSLNSGFIDYLQLDMKQEIAQQSQLGGGFGGSVLDLLQHHPGRLDGIKLLIWEWPLRSLYQPLADNERACLAQR